MIKLVLARPEALIQRVWTERGEVLPPTVEITVSPANLTPRIRARWTGDIINLADARVTHSGGLAWSPPAQIYGERNSPEDEIVLAPAYDSAAPPGEADIPVLVAALDAAMSTRVEAAQARKAVRKARENQARETRETRARETREREEAGLAALRAWALEHGSPLLRARIEEGYEWSTLAEHEYADAHAPAGYSRECYGRSDRVETRRRPTLDEITALREVRASLVPPCGNPRIAWHVVEEVVDEEGEITTPRTGYATIDVDITCPNGAEPTVSRRLA